MPGVGSPEPWHVSVPAMVSTPRLVLRGAVGRQQGRAPHRLCRRERREGTDGALIVQAWHRLHDQG